MRPEPGLQSVRGIDDNPDDNDDYHWQPSTPGEHLPRWDAFCEQGEYPA